MTLELQQFTERNGCQSHAEQCYRNARASLTDVSSFTQRWGILPNFWHIALTLPWWYSLQLIRFHFSTVGWMSVPSKAPLYWWVESEVIYALKHLTPHCQHLFSIVSGSWMIHYLTGKLEINNCSRYYLWGCARIAYLSNHITANIGQHLHPQAMKAFF